MSNSPYKFLKNDFLEFKGMIEVIKFNRTFK